MISLSHRTIFVHVPKCAGQSVEQAFLSDLAPDASFAQHRHLLACLPRPKGWSEAFPARLAHLKAHEYLDLDFVPRTIWDASYKFAIVRDPLERCVSMWRYRERYEGDFESFATVFLPEKVRTNFWYASQYAFTHSPHTGECLVDEIIPLEQLSARWNGVCERAGLRMRELPARNQSQKPKPESITARAREAIREVYADDYRHLATHFAA